MFATAQDVATRMGRELTAAEEAQAEFVIATVQGLLVETVSKDAVWADALDPVPLALRAICVEKARAVLANPTNIASQTESLGAWSHSETFPRSQDDIGIFLTDAEARIARFAVHGTNRASVMLGSVFQEAE